MKFSYKQGITAIELIIIVVVIGLLVAIALPQFSKIRENQVLKAATSDILSTIGKARSQTLASLNSSSYGVHFQSDQVIIFTGTVFSAGASGNETISIVSPATISNIALSGGATSIYFDRLNGAPSVSGTITVSSTNFTKTITISATGIASLN